MISHEELRRIVDYDPETGVMSWKDRAGFTKALVGQPCSLRTHKDGTFQIKLNKKIYRLHRVTWLYMTGEWPDRVRNKSGDFSDNRWSNLANGSRADDAARQAEKVAARKAEQQRLALERKALAAAAHERRKVERDAATLARKVAREEARATYLRDNAEQIKARKREQKKENRRRNPHTARARKSRERARLRNALDPAADKKKIAAIYKQCLRMQEITGHRYHVDHLVPIAKGGKHHQDNLVVMSGPLNELKSDHIIPELIRFFSPEAK